MFLSVSECFWVFLCVSVCFCVFLGFSGFFWVFLIFLGVLVFWGVFGCLGVGVFGCLGWLRVQGFLIKMVFDEGGF